MLLKRLELQGFKSFADKTILEFTDGATAVVGPNGSGKSNISDAIRWVIGETSAKTLRGSNMQDVIFTGTATRKGLNYAEVSLVLDNSNKDFNVDYEEVKVTRRLFRSGESVYRINDATCRLKDVHELFMDTGLGRDGYSIIGQGNVSQILSTKPEDRRSLFEEAAGVSKYKYKKEEAIRKLAKVEENLVRIGDISTELESQLAPLARQSEKARKYLDLYGDMKQLDINLSIISLDKNKLDIEKTDELYNSVLEELDSVKSKETENEKLMNRLYDESKKADEEKNVVNERLTENESKIATIKSEINLTENNILNNKANINRINDEISQIYSKNESRTAVISENESKIAAMRTESEIISDELANARKKFDNFDGELLKLDEEISNLRTEYFSNENEIVSLNERVKGIESLRTSFIERREAVYTEIGSFKESIENTKNKIEQTKAYIENRQQKLNSISETVNELERAKQQNEAEINTISRQLNQSTLEHNSKTSKKKILEGLENDYAGYAKSVKTVLTSNELKRYSIFGTVSGLTEVDKNYVHAIEAALGGAMQNIIVGSEEDAKAAISFLRRIGGGRATFLPVTSVKGRTLENSNEISKSEGYIGIASDLITYDKKYSGVFSSLLGRVVVVDNIDNAIAMSKRFGYKFKVVTLDGDVLNTGGSISGGSTNKQSGFLSRAAEIKSLTSEISALARNIKNLEEKYSVLKSDIELSENQLNNFVPLVREYEDEILKAENTLKILNDTLSKSSESGYETELEQIEKQLKESADEVAVLIAKASSQKTKNDSLEKSVQALVDNRNEIVLQKNECSDLINDKTDAISEINKNIALFAQIIDSTQTEIKNSEAEISKRNDMISELQEDSAKQNESINEKTKQLEASLELSKSIRESIKSIDERKVDITEKMQRYRGDNKDITNTIIELQKELSRIDSKRSKFQTDRDNIINRLWDDYELSYNDALEKRTEIEDLKEAQETLTELKKKIKSLGNVNMDAIEEYKAVKERYEFMISQKSDLDKSKVNLVKIIDSMEELMKEHFGDQFNDINKAFSEVFTELFGGGKGRLYLTDPDNILTSGIEIEVQLPGKGLQNINLYSGGEKSFIAIALLFAILRVKPTPFCILDEIDAALDDVNVSRFATYLKNYIDRTQFVVITHRRGTMEAASILYGVTMQESGVSKLLSLHIDDV
ncbi:MAG: chromosome segregation protein SMC, partial [Clostridia bacterium]|nr:chromosome segregation protein SMC [Clostridia bacterium]